MSLDSPIINTLFLSSSSSSFSSLSSSVSSSVSSSDMEPNKLCVLTNAIVLTDTENNEKKPASKYIKNNEGNYVCPHCNKITHKQNTMYYHIKKNHSQDLPFECTRCEVAPKFLQRSSYLHHLATIHADDLKLKDDEAAAVGGSNPYAGNSFTCPSCEHTTHTKSNIQIHFARTHCKDWIPTFIKDTACEGCDKVFKSSSAYLYHSTACFRNQASTDQLNVISRIR